MGFIDAHSHYNDEQFDEDRNDIILKNNEDGINKIVCAGYDVESSIKAIEIASKYDFLYATVGISPNDVPESLEEVDNKIKEIENLINGENANKIIAVGEIGLDYHWNTENKEIQKMMFKRQIELANKYELPIQIHTREATIDTIQMLKDVPVIKKGMFHCCPLNQELIKEALKLDFYISFAGPITFKNTKNAEDIIKMIPINRIFTETDSPYLAPEPNRGKRNNPGNVKYVAEKIAEYKQISVAKLNDNINNNFFELYRKK